MTKVERGRQRLTSCSRRQLRPTPSRCLTILGELALLPRVQRGLILPTALMRHYTQGLSPTRYLGQRGSGSADHRPLSPSEHNSTLLPFCPALLAEVHLFGVKHPPPPAAQTVGCRGEREAQIPANVGFIHTRPAGRYRVAT